MCCSQEDESASSRGDDASDSDENDEKNKYDKPGKLKKMKHEQVRDGEAEQVSYLLIFLLISNYGLQQSILIEFIFNRVWV